MKDLLPKYWIVQCPVDIERNENWKRIINYLNSIHNTSKWGGNSPHAYYGYDGNSSFGGTNCFQTPEGFKNNPKILTIAEWIHLMDFPEKWYVLYNSEEEFKKMRKFSGRSWTFNSTLGRYGVDSDKDWVGGQLSTKELEQKGYVKISFEEFQTYVLKELFTLPTLWCVERTRENYEVLNAWANSHEGVSGTSAFDGWIHSVNYGPMGWGNTCGHFFASPKKHPHHKEITFEQFKKYVLNENTSELPSSELPDKWCVKADGAIASEWFDKQSHKDCYRMYDYGYLHRYSLSGGNDIMKEGNLNASFHDSGIRAGYTEISLEQFERLVMNTTPEKKFTLPENWALKITSEEINNAVNAARIWEHGNLSYEDTPAYNQAYIHSNGRYNASERNEGFEEITFEQFKEHVLKQPTMKKKTVIGYKAPMDFYAGNVRKGDVLRLKPDESFKWYVNSPTNETYTIPKEVVESWEPVYEEESVVLYFSDVQFTIRKGQKYAETRYGNISIAEIEKALDYIAHPPKIGGYYLSINQEGSTLLHPGDKIFIGCKEGTVQQLTEILKALRNA